MAPVNTIRESWPLLEVVAEFADAGHVLEVDLLGVDYGELEDSAPLTDLEDFMVPLLARGLLTSASDALGRIGYGITPAGRAALARGKPKPSKDSPKYDSALGREYAREYLALVEERENWKPERPGLVAVPLSAGMWPRKVSR
jgi:hypothetical protein